MALTTLANLNGMFKYIFGDGPINVIPDYTKILKKVPFAKADQLGRNFIFPVIVGRENGITFNTDGSIFTLNGALSMQTAEASLSGAELAMRTNISYKQASSAQNSKQAFANLVEIKTRNLAESHAKYAEVELLYGGSGYGNCSAHSTTSATREVLTITAASWSDGIWAGSKGMAVNFYANDNSTLISSGADSVFTIFSVDHINQKITVDGTSTGCTALAAATYTGAGLYVYPNGAFGKQMVGINKILTTSGSVFGIDNSTYDLWAGNNLTTTGDLSFAKINDAIITAVGRGLMEDVTVYVSPKQWSKLSADQASLRRFDQTYKKGKAENGFDGQQAGAITFYGANGKLEIEPHPMVKNGDAFFLPMDTFKRVGASDITFERPGSGKSGEFFVDLQDVAGYELRSYSDFAIIAEKPARCTKLSGFNA